MRQKLKFLTAVLLSILPFNILRCFFYRHIFGYQIIDSSIGFGTVIFVTQARMDRCSIGRFNKFLGPMTLSIGQRSRIETHNTFDCGDWTADERHSSRYERTLFIGDATLITNWHFFDVAGHLSIGKGSWIAGRGSQFWTHGVNTEDRNISIGSHSYIGSAVRFAPGSGVADNVIVALGSIVTRRFTESDALIGGCPAKLLKESCGWKMRRPADVP
jgi:acetyltransferase-like isoleucine patch superfamily enzyme